MWYRSELWIQENAVLVNSTAHIRWNLFRELLWHIKVNQSKVDFLSLLRFDTPKWIVNHLQILQFCDQRLSILMQGVELHHELFKNVLVRIPEDVIKDISMVDFFYTKVSKEARQTRIHKLEPLSEVIPEVRIFEVLATTRSLVNIRVRCDKVSIRWILVEIVN